MAQTDLDLARKIARPFGIAEDLLGFVFANLMTVVFLFIMHKMVGRSKQPNELLLILCWLTLDIPYIIRLWRAMFRGPRPATFAAANAHTQLFAPVLRFLVATWWLAHFLIGVALMFAFHIASGAMKKDHTKPPPEWVIAVMAMCIGFASNGYLLLTASSLTTRQSIRRIVWRSRAMIDITLGILGYFLATQLT